MSYEQIAYTYDRLMEEMPYSEWLSFAKEGWRRYGLKPATLADLGCGTGSLAIPLALEGIQGNRHRPVGRYACRGAEQS